jgi:hypothetical protein
MARVWQTLQRRIAEDDHFGNSTHLEEVHKVAPNLISSVYSKSSYMMSLTHKDSL